MGVLEDTVVKAKDVIDTVGKKSGDFISLQKLKIDVAKTNSLISKDFETLGRIVYTNMKNSAEPDDGTDEIVASIREHRKTLRELEKMISENKGTLLCAECGNTNPSEADFCSKCGSRLVK